MILSLRVRLLAGQIINNNLFSFSGRSAQAVWPAVPLALVFSCGLMCGFYNLLPHMSACFLESIPLFQQITNGNTEKAHEKGVRA